MIVYEICGNAGAGKTTVANILMKIYSFKGKFICKTSLASELKRLIEHNLFITKHGFTTTSFDEKKLKDGIVSLISEAIQTNSLYVNGHPYIGLISDGTKEFIKENKLEDIISEIIDAIMDAKDNPNNIAKSARKVLQFVGTNIIRDHINPEYWLHRVVERIKRSKDMGVDVFIIDDYRFPNEDLCDYLYLCDDDIKIVRMKVSTYDYVRMNRLGIDKTQFDKMSAHPSESQVNSLIYDSLVINNSTEDDLEEGIKLALL